jgi:HPt (histidine-containing phosphotransfer) domain-containing protein
LIARVPSGRDPDSGSQVEGRGRRPTIDGKQRTVGVLPRGSDGLMIARNHGRARIARARILAVTADAVRGDDERSLPVGIDCDIGERILVLWLDEEIERIDPEDLKMTRGGGSDAGAYGVDRLKGVVGDDDQLAAQVAGAFLQVRPELQARLRDAAAAADAAAFAGAAHELKGMAGMIGAERLALAAKTLEQAAKGGNRAAFTDPALLAELADEWERVARVLEAIVPRR